MHIKSFLEGGFPGRIIWVGLGTDFRVSLDRDRVGREEAHHLDLTLLSFEDSSEHPPIRAGGRPVFLFNPPARFVGVSSLRPNPEGFEDFVIDRMKHVLADRMAVIQGPSAYHRHAVSKDVFHAVDHEIFKALWVWAQRRHPHKTRWW